MAIERAVIENIHKARAEGNEEQERQAILFYGILNTFKANGFQDLPVEGFRSPLEPELDTPSLVNYIVNSRTLVGINGQVCHLSNKQNEIMAILVQNKGIIVPHDHLIEKAGIRSRENLAVQIQRLRGRIDKTINAVEPLIWIDTVYNLGYRLLGSIEEPLNPMVTVSLLPLPQE